MPLGPVREDAPPGSLQTADYSGVERGLTIDLRGVTEQIASFDIDRSHPTVRYGTLSRKLLGSPSMRDPSPCAFICVIHGILFSIPRVTSSRVVSSVARLKRKPGPNFSLKRSIASRGTRLNAPLLSRTSWKSNA